MSTPFNVDLAAQLTQTHSFQSIVEAAMANNNRLAATADAAHTVNVGRMNIAFQQRMEEVKTTALSSNVKLQGICDALGFGVKSTSSTEEGNAAMFTSGGFFK